MPSMRNAILINEIKRLKAEDGERLKKRWMKSGFFTVLTFVAGIIFGGWLWALLYHV